MKQLLNLMVFASAVSFGLQAHASGDAAAGKEVASKCQSCHGANGNSSDPQFPRLAGQHADYLVKALSEYKSGARSNPIMAGFAAGLTDDDINNVAAWFAGQNGLITSAQARTVSK